MEHIQTGLTLGLRIYHFKVLKTVQHFDASVLIVLRAYFNRADLSNQDGSEDTLRNIFTRLDPDKYRLVSVLIYSFECSD